jgi:hypothetical protein
MADNRHADRARDAAPVSAGAAPPDQRRNGELDDKEFASLLELLFHDRDGTRSTGTRVVFALT